MAAASGAGSGSQTLRFVASWTPSLTPDRTHLEDKLICEVGKRKDRKTEKDAPVAKQNDTFTKSTDKHELRNSQLAPA